MSRTLLFTTRRALAALLLVTLAAGDANAADSGNGADALVVRLAPGARSGELAFELVNTGGRALAVLPAGTPLEPTLSEDLFEVRRVRKGWPMTERAPYVGRLAKRAAPRPEDFVVLAPGETLAAGVDLARHYAIGEADEYRVRFTGTVLELPEPPTARARTALAPIVVRPAANVVELDLAPDPAGLARARPPQFESCDAGEQELIVEATLAAENLAGESFASLRDLPPDQRPGSPRYERWFGAHETERYATVAAGFSRILDTLSGATLNFDCSCSEENLYAFVHPVMLNDVYLCPRFFAAPLDGTDSRAGTLVHELSHFTALVGTDDNVYGQSAAESLALRDPALAIDNADSFEYFAENDPVLPMSAATGVVPVADDPATVGPVATDGFVELASGGEREGRLEEGEIDRYETSGVDLVELVSVDGDADLYVYDDPGLDDAALVCSAAGDGSETPSDVCELPDDARPYYVAVLGYTAAGYRLVAGTSERPAVDTPSADAALDDAATGGSTAEGELELGEVVVYTARAPLRVELVSTSGDADLFVFAGDELAADEEICRSIETVGTDVCEVEGSGDVQIVVGAYTDSTFVLESSAVDDGVASGAPTDDDPAGSGADAGAGTGTGTGAGTGAGTDGGIAAGAGSGGSAGGGGGSVDWPSLLAGFLLLAFGSTGCTPRASTSGASTPGLPAPGAVTARDGPATGGDESAPGTGADAGHTVAAPSADVDGTLVATVGAVRGRSARGEPLELRLTVRNEGTRPLELLRWNTPFETTLSADLFEITRDGEAVPYLGRLVKRAPPPPAEDRIRLAPGERLEGTVDLARAYALGRPGLYRIRFAPAPPAIAGDFAPLASDGREIVVERY